MIAQAAADDRPPLARRIRDEREWCGYSREQVAQVVHVPEHVIEAFEDGRQAPTAQELERLARLFGLSPARLLGEPLTEPAPKTVCQLRSGELTHADQYTLRRFAEYLRHSGRAPRPLPRSDASGDER